MAIFLTIAIKTGRTAIDPFVMSSLAFESEPWRLASSALPHGDWLHLIFNIIWMWVLGTKLEEVLGHVTTLAIMLVLAVGSGAAQFAFADGGIGLSGVGYGLVGCLWILAKRDKRFRDAIDRNVLIMFFAWGVLCVVLTVTNVWRIGNIAHGSGFVLGALIGRAIAPGPKNHRATAGIALAVIVAALVGGAGWARPHINLSATAAGDDGYRGAQALGDKQYELAARHLRRAIALAPGDADNWYNYGIALQHVDDPEGRTALDVWKRATALAPDDAQFKRALANEYTRQGIEAQQRDELPRAAELYTQSIATLDSATARWNLGLILQRQGKRSEAEAERARALALDPAIVESAAGSAE